MTIDTTMTDVDTSREKIESRIMVLRSYQFNESAQLLYALAAERDELERLAGDALALVTDALDERGELALGPYEARMENLYSRLTAYQRKHNTGKET